MNKTTFLDVPENRLYEHRAILKTITWRVLASLDTMLLSWLITGSAIAGLSIASGEVLTKMALYYVHERGWQRVLRRARVGRKLTV